MIDTLVNALANRPVFDEFNHSDWRNLLIFINDLPANQHALFYRIVANHTGIPVIELKNAFQSFQLGDTEPYFQELLFQSLQSHQHNASEKIQRFQQFNYFSTIDIDSLHLTRGEWLLLIYRFQQQNRSFVTAGFFINHLSEIRKITSDELLQNDSLRRLQPARASKPKLEKTAGSKRNFDYYHQDLGENSLILDSQNVHPELRDKIQKTGARCEPLVPASPEPNRAYANLKLTPGGNKARIISTIGEHAFFKHITPYVNKVAPGRADIRQTLQENVQRAIPNLSYEKAEKIEFVATLESIAHREGVPRDRSQNAIKNASASDVFRAHGIAISAKQNRSHHWAHLIAYFLGGDQGYANLIPSTAAANYNTLQNIELYIKKLLTENDVAEVAIIVEPVYSNENLLIPDMLIYSLSWEGHNKVEKCQETFHINPQSYQRITRSMRDSITVLREEEFEPLTKKKGPRL